MSHLDSIKDFSIHRTDDGSARFHIDLTDEWHHKRSQKSKPSLSSPLMNDTVSHADRTAILDRFRTMHVSSGEDVTRISPSDITLQDYESASAHLVSVLEPGPPQLPSKSTVSGRKKKVSRGSKRRLNKSNKSLHDAYNSCTIHIASRLSEWTKALLEDREDLRDPENSHLFWTDDIAGQSVNESIRKSLSTVLHCFGTDESGGKMMAEDRFSTLRQNAKREIGGPSTAHVGSAIVDTSGSDQSVHHSERPIPTGEPQDMETDQHLADPQELAGLMNGAMDFVRKYREGRRDDGPSSALSPLKVESEDLPDRGL